MRNGARAPLPIRSTQDNYLISRKGVVGAQHCSLRSAAALSPLSIGLPV